MRVDCFLPDDDPAPVAEAEAEGDVRLSLPLLAGLGALCGVVLALWLCGGPW